MTDDSNGELEELKIDRQRRAMARAEASGGAHMGGDHGDKRVTRLIDWVLVCIGGIIITLMWRAGDALVDLKVNMATVTTRLDAKDARDDEQDRRLGALEGKTFRGVDGYGKQEPGRGR